MCGIVGYFNKNSSRDYTDSVIEKMDALQKHRGPDSSGKFINTEGNFGLKMCRLSILDLELGIQPMHSNDKRFTIIFNGTILNSPELRTDLELKGIKFYTNNSDTEVLLNIMIFYGVDGIQKLNGSFAFAFYDNQKKKLICARDRFGAAPFYYFFKNDTFCFASEMKSILLSKISSKEINMQSLSHYLSLHWVPGPETIIKDINKLSPGCFIEFDINNLSFKNKKWYHFNFEHNYSIQENEWPELILDSLRRSVKRATLSDVPMTCGLSGGLDSQAIVGLLSQIGHRPKTFALGFEGCEEGQLNELKSAKRMAELYGTDHEEIVINEKEYFDDLDKMVYHLDQPYGGGLPLWHVFKNAGKDYSVMLTGLGGDEFFGNFGKWTLLEKTLFNLTNSKFQYKSLIFDRKSFFTDEFKKKLLDENHLENLTNTSDYLFNILNENKTAKNIKDKICYLDLTTQLPDEYSNMINKFSMANKIEARAPFLDNEFSELML
ncbi:asparagine synthase (glutamine-hydrolyzing), partial [Candidatus Pelagibacter sp.]|nr:asparagine synthase (glutamine-hydrolyzing) [Candidatus Pelagibacter sp.]